MRDNPKALAINAMLERLAHYKETRQERVDYIVTSIDLRYPVTQSEPVDREIYLRLFDRDASRLVDTATQGIGARLRESGVGGPNSDSAISMQLKTIVHYLPEKMLADGLLRQKEYELITEVGKRPQMQKDLQEQLDNMKKNPAPEIEAVAPEQPPAPSSAPLDWQTLVARRGQGPRTPG